MSVEETAEEKKQAQKVLLMILIATSLLICCCVVMLILYFVMLFSARPNLLQPRTLTPVSLEEINSGTALGKFYFGLDDVDDFCHVKRQTDKFSQEEILKSEYLYLSIPFATKYENEKVAWDVYDLHGKSILDGDKHHVTLDSDMDHCLTGYIFINPRTEPGNYILEVKHENKLAYREVFTITPSDLDKIHRPTRKPFGNITMGRRIDDNTCTATDQSSSNTYNLTDLKDDPWFYIASPFQLSDLDKEVYWSVRNANNKNIFGSRRIKRVIYDKMDLCFWQGFSMKDFPAGKYTIFIEDDQFKVIYQSDFELK